MNTQINKASENDYDKLLIIWESSVRSSHHFLKEEDIAFYKTMIKTHYFSAVDLYLIRNEKGEIAGFTGLSADLIEMLFIAPEEQGKGYGKKLIEFAIKEKQIKKVDVNEQNTAALFFYTRIGFEIIGRNDTDASGKPYPILHMQIIDTPILETKRLLLRPFMENDAEDVFSYCQNPNLGNNAGWQPHTTIKESLTITRNIFMSQSNIWAIVLKSSGKLIGCAGIITDPKRQNVRTRMIGYWLGEEHWGKGYISEAVQELLRYGFNTLHLHLISAYCYPHNLRSRHVLERNGFTYEGTLRQSEQTYDGHIYDELCYYIENNRT
ncbi:MAG: GNAT family N-acetyltransferase [Bacteroidaceae bacterium]|nr:GNAT family N-acetyltransferase [Bacteroidaceae bacterium]